MSQNNLMELIRVKATNHYENIVAPSGLRNGYLVKLNTRNTNGTYTTATPSVTSKKLALVADVNLSYRVEEEMNDKAIEAGEIIRVLILEEGNKIGIPQANISKTNATANALVVGRVVVPTSTYAMECLDALGSTESLAFEIERLYEKAGIQMAQLRVILADRQ